MGDMFQATSTNDITFWVLHPSLDRLWHFMRLHDSYTEGWDATSTCVGHNPEDIQPFTPTLFNLDAADADTRFDGDWNPLLDQDSTGVYTNQALYDRLHPANDYMPYVYDNFEWPHCEALGYDMGP